MNKRCTSFYRFLLAVLAFALLMGACGGPRYQTGLDAVTQTGRWMSVLQPVQDADPLLAVVDINTGYTQMTLTDAYIYQQPITTYSPSGNYLLYRGNEMWKLVEISTQSIWDVAPTSMGVEFLRDDELLITQEQGGTSSDGTPSKKMYQLSRTYPTSPGQENWREITKQGRYIFKSWAQGLSTIQGASYASNTPVQAFCSPAPVQDQDTRVIVDNDRTVWVLTSNARSSSIHSWNKLSATTAELLKNHETVQEALALLEIKNTPEYANLSDAEKAAMVDSIARSGITGLASPDGQHLLILTATSISSDVTKYSLNLINLETDKRIVLSSDSDWAPAFLFSPDGKQILYESSNQGERAWYLGSADGSNTIWLPLQGIGSLCWH